MTKPAVSETEGQPSESWDVVVIGSGLGGLTSAACLASAGRRVLVLERHDVAGGNATVFRRHPRAGTEGDAPRQEFEFDVGVHYIGECQPGGLFPSIFNALGVGDRVQFNELDPDGFDTVVFPEVEVKIPAGWDRYEAAVVEAVPGDRAAVERCVRTLSDIARESRERYIPGAETPTFDRWVGRTLAELFDECELSSTARAILGHWGGLYAGAPSQTSAVTHAGIVHHYMNGAYYPAGGGQVLAARLIQVIEALGGEVRCLARVDHVMVYDDRCVQGVELADGSRIDARLVISNADHLRTVQHLVDARHWDPATIEFAANAQMTLGLAVVYVVVDTDLTADLPNTNYHVFSNADHEAVYASLDAGELPEGDWAYLAFASKKDPDNHHVCPPGHTNFQIMTLAPRGWEFWGVEDGPADGPSYRRNETYRQRKAELTERMLNAAEKVLGPFRDHIVHIETATPLSHQRYTHATGGTSYGYLHSPEQSGSNRPAHRTEVHGLWVTGANTSSGHGIAGAMVGGVNTAGQILDRSLLIEMLFGAQLVDPASVPADPAGFDPLHHSRGARLRAKREKSR